MSERLTDRDELASQYLDQLPYEPYPVQEDALLTWFSADESVLVCAPTGTGKTLIAEAALFEALHLGRTAYYTTPLIALTEQKFRELQEAAERWGFSATDVGLVTGNRTVNPDATILVVVAEILLNRLLHTAVFDFSEVSTVVMDEFHSFADPSRGAVWELSLALLPNSVRLLLLSATVGNSAEFITWLHKSHKRRVRLVQGNERRVPLMYTWVGDQLLDEQLQIMSEGDDETRTVPALVFCFNRDQCWSVADQLRGKNVLSSDQKATLAKSIEDFDWSNGAGPKLKQILLRGIGIHHAGLLPRYRRAVEHLFQRKLLSVVICTETLAAGINLPARSVVLTTLLKGPPGKKRVIDASSAHQMFGRAGRPQFDTAGFVYVMAHEDDVKIQRWREKYDTIPDDVKDPQLIKAKKRLKKKMPTRRKTEQYWNEAQFDKLTVAPPGKLYSKGQLPWRLLAYMLSLSPDVERIRRFVRKRLMDAKRLDAAEKVLHRQLISLWAGGFITLDPEPPPPPDVERDEPVEEKPPEAQPTGTFAGLLQDALNAQQPSGKQPDQEQGAPAEEEYRPETAEPTAALQRLIGFRSINPVYGAYLLSHLGLADDEERVQILESVLELSPTVARLVRVPPPEVMPPGPLAQERVDTLVVQRGLATHDELYPQRSDDGFFEERRFPVPLADKLRMLFQSEFPDVRDVNIRPVWAAGDLLNFNGNFNKFIGGRNLAKQEGIMFRHFLRLILLCGEFSEVCPDDTDADEWRGFLNGLAEQLTSTCREVDPDSTDEAMQSVLAADLVVGESRSDGAFGSGVIDFD